MKITIGIVLTFVALTPVCRTAEAPIVNQKHPSSVDHTRFHTNRDGRFLELPDEEDSFFFAVYADRTGGPAEGVRVLAQAVRETNLLEPDLVMTVGDLIEGYNATEEWLVQMREFRRIMDNLLMPWFPVAGNHDIYWRSDTLPRPEREHEANYEEYFAPLWYAFEHKDCWFIVLHTDEGNPVTGEMTYSKPEAQRMSPEQFSWLQETLKQSSEAKHVFVFLHHPRWLKGGYGDDWDRAHQLLADAGNVSAVFAGHIHRMRYDGPFDGIEYVTLATIGGSQSSAVPQAGYLHQYHLVTVREDQIAIASIPVGQIINVRQLTGKVSNEARLLSRVRPEFNQRIEVRSDGSVDEIISAKITNPVMDPVQVYLSTNSDDARWTLSPSSDVQTLGAGESFQFAMRAFRWENSLDLAWRPPRLSLAIDYIPNGIRYQIPRVNTEIPVRVDLPAPVLSSTESVIYLDGADDYLRIDDDLYQLPDGPLTVECWFNARTLNEGIGLVTKNNGFEFGIFLNEGVPSFTISLGDKSVEAKAKSAPLETDRWYHLAGVYDAAKVMLFLDGTLVATQDGFGSRKRTSLPLVIGGQGQGEALLNGQIDGVRVSSTARYRDSGFKPDRRPKPDSDTALLFNMDSAIVQWLYDESSNRAHAKLIGSPSIQAQR